MSVISSRVKEKLSSIFFFSSRRRHTRLQGDWSSDVCSSDLLLVFIGNVIARQDNAVQYADRMEVYLDEKGDGVVRAISTGGVRIITRDCRTGTAKRAEYYELEQRVVLVGDARVWQDDNVVSGDTITIYLSEDRSIVQGAQQERVKAVFYPREDSKKGGPSRTASEPCRN